LPKLHKLKGSLRANAKILRHEHSSHHDIVLPFFIGLNTLVEVISPISRLVKDLLDTKSLHLTLVLQYIVKDALSDGVEVVLVDFIQHRVNQVLDLFLLNSMKISRDELNDVSQPVLSNGSNNIN
jgi:hypothetical protein